MGGAATVGRLVVTVAGDVDQLKIDMREAQAITGAATKEIVNGLQGVTEATYARNDAGKRMIAALQQELDTFGMSTDEINIHKASLAGVGEQYSAMISRLNEMKSSQAAFTSQLASSEAAATQRIREMVAASAAEGDAMRSATAATQGASAAMAQMTGVSRNWSDAQKLAAQNMAGVGASMRAAQGDTAAMSVETQKILDKYDPLGTKLRSLEAEFTNLRKAMGNSVDPAAIKAFQGLEDEITRTKNLMATAGAEGFGKLEDGAKKSAFATAGATRELIVLGHEALTGNFSRMPGSAMVLAERMGGLASFITPITVGVLALGISAAAFAVAAYRGADESDKFGKSLALTGNFAAITEGQFNSMARSMADSEGVGIGQARAALQSLVSTGQFSGAALTSVGAAALTMSRMTGQSADEVVAEFAKMADGVVKWVDEHDKQYHFLSTAQYQHIRELAESGRAQEAMAETGKLVDEALKKNTDNLGYLRTGLKSAREAWHDFWDAAEKVGRTATPEDRIAKAQADIVHARTTGRNPNGPTRAGGMSQSDMDTFIQQQSDLIVAAIKDKDAAEAKATADGERTRIAAEGKQAVREVSDMRKRYQDRAAAEKAEIKAYTDNMAKIAAGGGKADSDAEQARMIADIHKNYEQRAAAGSDASKSMLNGELADIKASVDAEKARYEQLNKLDEMRHKAGEQSDKDYYDNKRSRFDAMSAVEAAGYDAQLASLRAFHGKTAVARQDNANKILAELAAQSKAVQKYQDESQALYVEALLRSLQPQKQVDAAMADHLKKLTEEADKAEAANRVHGKSKSILDDEAEATNNLAIAVERTAIARLGETEGSESEIVIRQKRIQMLQDENIQLERTAKALDQKAILDANDRAAAEASKAWKHTSDTIQNDLTNAILDGGGKGFKKLIHDMEFAFARMILQPIISPISQGIASYLNPMAAQAQAGGAVGLSGAIGAASNAYSMFTGGMSLAGGLGTGFMGSVSGGLMGAGAGAGLTSSAGLAIGEGIANVVGPAAASAISSGMSMVATAMPWLAAAAIGGVLLHKAFGHGERETTSSTLTGSFGDSGFSGDTIDKWKEAGGWFSSDKTGVTSTAVDAATAKQYGDGYKALQTAASQFAQALGVNASSISTRSQTMSIALTADANANKQAIADFFTGVGNSMATELVPNLADFAKAGEAASATLQRLAGDFQATDQFAAMLGKSATDLFGAAGIGSAAARERLIDASGGAAAVGQKTAAYMQSFYNEADKIAPVIKTVGEAMDSLGLASITTKLEFKAQVDGMLKSGALATADGAKLYASLMDLAPAFAQAADYADTLTAATLAAAAASADATKAAASSLLNEVDNQFSVLQRVLKSSTDVLTARIAKEQALSSAIKSTLDSMKMPATDLSSRASAQADIKAAIAIAKASGVLPDAPTLQKSLGVLGQDASGLFSTYQDYQRDFYSTQNDIASLGQSADAALSTDQASLDSLNGILAAAQAQIDLLKGIDTSGLTVANAIAGFNLAVAGAQANPVSGSTAAINSAYQSALGRAPDKAGMDYWQNALANGNSLSGVLAAINGSSEAQSHKVPGFATGGDFGGGMRIVGERGPELEMTGPSRITNSDTFMSSLRNPANNSVAIVAELKASREANARMSKMLESALYAIAKHTKITADGIDDAVTGTRPIKTQAAT